MKAKGAVASIRGGKGSGGAAPRLSVLLLALLTGCSSLRPAFIAAPNIGGSISTGVLLRDTPSSESELVLQSVASIRASSYIWQPWFAPVTSSGGVAYERRTGRRANEGDALRFNGDLSLGLLPQSRFPARLSYSRLDSRVSGQFSGADFIQNRFAFSTTSIFTGKFRTNAGVAIDWSEQAKTGDRRSKRFYGGATKTFGRNFAGLQSMALSVDYTTSAFDSLREGELSEDVLSATFSLHAKPGPDATNNLVVTFISDDEVSRTVIANRRSLQAVNNFNWNPQGKIYNIDGFIRARIEEIEFGDVATQPRRRNNQLLGAVNSQISLSERLHVRLGIRAGADDRTGSIGGPQPGDSDTRSFVAAGATVNYFSKTRKFGAYDWRWGARASGETGWESEDDLIRNPTAAVNQTLERDVPFFGETPARLSFTQEVGFDSSAVNRGNPDDEEFTPIVSHGLAFSYSSGGQSGSTSFVVSLRDNRELSGDRDSLQTAQVQFNRNQALDARRSFTGSLTANALRRTLAGDEDTIVSASGRLVYNHRSIFDLLNLEFRSEVAVNIFELDELFSEDPEPTFVEDIQHHEWRNYLTYHIGKIAVVGEASAFYEDEGLGTLFMIRIRRDFGGN
jgi:hypothetical protein